MCAEDQHRKFSVTANMPANPYMLPTPYMPATAHMPAISYMPVTCLQGKGWSQEGSLGLRGCQSISRFSERPYLQGLRWDVTEEGSRPPHLASAHMHKLKHMQTQLCMYHPQTQLKRSLCSNEELILLTSLLYLSSTGVRSVYHRTSLVNP